MGVGAKWESGQPIQTLILNAYPRSLSGYQAVLEARCRIREVASDFGHSPRHPMTRNGEPAGRPLKMRSIAILGLLLIMLGALSLYQGVSEEAPLWLPWTRGSLAMASGLGLVVLSLNRARGTRAFVRQTTISRLSHDATLDCAAGVSGGTAAEINGIAVMED
jgi:hypothetical protein